MLFLTQLLASQNLSFTKAQKKKNKERKLKLILIFFSYRPA